MKVTLQVRSTFMNWEEKMRPTDDTGNSRKRESCWVYTSVLSAGYGFGDASFLAVGDWRIQTVEPLVIGQVFEVELKLVKP